MANKITLVDEIKAQFNRNADDLFDEAILLCLENNFEKNKNEIIKLFVTSFINEKNIDIVKVYNFKSRNLLLQGYSIKSGIFLRNNNFKNSNRILNDISTIFHELTHITTDLNNNKKSFINNDIFDYYVDLNNVGLWFNEGLSYAMYYLSPNELNSRKSEIFYIKKFIARMEFLLDSFDELKTKENLKLLNKYKKTLIKIDNNLKKNILKYEIIINDNKSLLKFKTKKAFDYIKKCDNHKINLKKKKFIKKLNLSIYLIEIYLNICKDKEFFNMVFNYVQDKQMNSFSYLRQNIVNILNSGCKNFTKMDVDKLLIVFNSPDFISKMNLDKLDLLKHGLLFYGDTKLNNFQEIFGQKISENLIKKTSKRFKNIKFIGIDYDCIIDKDGKCKYLLKLNGEGYKFSSEKELLLEVSKHINSSMLDDLNEETINKINSVFEKDIILDLSKQQQEKLEEDYKKVKNKHKKKDYLFSDVFETEHSFTF